MRSGPGPGHHPDELARPEGHNDKDKDKDKDKEHESNRQERKGKDKEKEKEMSSIGFALLSQERFFMKWKELMKI